MRITNTFVLIFALACLIAPVTHATAAAPDGPSFDCSKPSEIEAVICRNPELSADDRHMAALYQAAKPGALGVGSNELNAQRDWLKDLKKECADGAWKNLHEPSLRDCVALLYRDRLRALAVATLMTTPETSLSELRQIDPKAAPIYEALFDYASINDAPRRIKAVENLLTPIYAAMDQDARNAFKSAGANAMTAHDAAASDVGFAQFFDISAMFGNVELTWPCEALLKRPGLIAGLGSLWGGAIDGQVPSSDCEAMLPQTPLVAAVSQQAMDAQPVCEGTIRFSTGRDYVKLSDAVLMHRTDVWGPAAPNVDGSGQQQRRFQRKHAAEIVKAEAELSAYYVRYYGIARDKAQGEAASAIEALIGGAFGYCE
jgi:uncharacterized protein YecT (DUF1311 family)